MEGHPSLANRRHPALVDVHSEDREPAVGEREREGESHAANSDDSYVWGHLVQEAERAQTSRRPATTLRTGTRLAAVSDSRVSPTISIVTAVLNRAGSIGRALASVREQDYPDVEHVVIDGGSTDGTIEILDRSEGIRWVSEPDDGLADAMNKGIAMATGDWIGWLNSDDYYLPGALKAVAEAVESHPDARWVTGTCRIIDAGDREMRTAITAYKNWLLRHYSFPLYLTQNFVSCPSTFVRKDAYEAVGPLDPRYRISMDYDVFLRIARRWDPVVLDRALAVFRMEQGTLSIDGFERQFAEHAEQARRHGAGYPLSVAANQLISRGIVLTYRLMRARRRLARSASAT